MNGTLEKTLFLINAMMMSAFFSYPAIKPADLGSTRCPSGVLAIAVQRGKPQRWVLPELKLHFYSADFTMKKD